LKVFCKFFDKLPYFPYNGQMEGVRITKFPTIHCEQDVEVCAKLHDNLSNSFPTHFTQNHKCQAVTVALEEKTGNNDTQEDSSSGNHLH